jgi:transposase
MIPIQVPPSGRSRNRRSLYRSCQDSRRTESWPAIPAEIKTRRVKKQKTDRQDAQLLLKWMMEDRFPRIWVPSPENRDVRQLLWRRHRLVQKRTRIMNQLQALAMNEGRRWKSKLWNRGERNWKSWRWLPGPAGGDTSCWICWTAEPDHRGVDRRGVDRAAELEARKRPEALRLMTHAECGPAYGPGLRVDHWNSEAISSWLQ